MSVEREPRVEREANLTRGNPERTEPEVRAVAVDLASGALRHTVLLVEDEAFVRQVAGETLEAAGFRVLVARTANEALALLQSDERRVDVLLTDLVLPDSNGLALDEELKRHRPDLRTIFISGYPRRAIRRPSGRGQNWSYLAKPFCSASLIDCVRRALGQRGGTKGRHEHAGPAHVPKSRTGAA